MTPKEKVQSAIEQVNLGLDGIRRYNKIPSDTPMSDEYRKTIKFALEYLAQAIEDDWTPINEAPKDEMVRVAFNEPFFGETTPEEAVLPLLPHIEHVKRFAEPCAGDGQLVRILESHGHFCYFKSDIEPQAEGIIQADALTLTNPIEWAGCIITNPPWDRKILHPMIDHFRKHSITWLLFDADWMHTKQSAPYMRYCDKIVSVGRVKWIPDSKMTDKDNCAWYRFGAVRTETKFYGR